jgi:CRP-like cAMP-binding protein
MHNVTQNPRAHVQPPFQRQEDSLQNSLLARLPGEELAKLAPQLTVTPFEPGRVIFEPGEPMGSVHFILKGAVSLLAALPDGHSQYVAIIGREGALGLSTGLGSTLAFCRAIVLSPMVTGSMPVFPFSEFVQQSAALRALIVSYNDVLLAQSQQALVCNTAHYLQARLCRWLLHAKDATGSQTLQLTQQFLSEILGAQRTSVNLILGTLQAEGLLEVQRGRIHLRDLEALHRKSCCCYAAAQRVMSGMLLPEQGPRADRTATEARVGGRTKERSSSPLGPAQRHR